MDPSYGPALARIHHEGFGGYAERIAPGVLALLRPVAERRGLVLEVGCGSGLLTRHLVDAGHRVVATDASPAMIELARAHVPDAHDVRRLTLPDDPLPEVDAVVGVGHPLNYLPDEAAVHRGLVAMCAALRPGGLLVTDLCDLAWGRAREGEPARGWTGGDWALITATSVPSPDRFVRDMTIFVRDGQSHWRREHERHENVLLETARVPALLAAHGVEATLRSSFGDEDLAPGLVPVVGRRTGAL